MRNNILFLAFIIALIISSYSGNAQQQSSPNIIVVLADDLGYGDVTSMNKASKIKTPHLDKLASDGMIFTDAHSGSSVCTPTRYGLLTGRYSWRTRLQKGVVGGFANSLIAPDRPTIGGFLKTQGYHAAIIGKWHVNFNYQDSTTGAILKRPKGKGLPPVGSKIPDGPVNRGFDYFHGFHHARNMKAVINNDKVIEHDDEINMLPRITKKSVEYINERAAKSKDQPFFLYVPLNSPHTPILPSKEWQGKSGISPYADFVMQSDACLGAIMDVLEKNNLSKNTLVIFSSDNGCSKAADIKELIEHGHHPSAHLRGSKADIWDGGHRVPFIVKWPGKVKAGSKSGQTICLTDLFATFADILDKPIPEVSCEDSYSFLKALHGKPLGSERKGVIHHSISGHFAYRMGKWKLCLAKGSGGWTNPKEKEVPEGTPIAQLYNMEDDPGETKNLYQSRPEIVKQLLTQLEYEVKNGRTTKGKESNNDVNDIILWKSGQ